MSNREIARVLKEIAFFTRLTGANLRREPNNANMPPRPCCHGLSS